MFKADDYRLKIKALGETLGEAKYALDIDNRAEELKKLKEEQEKPEVWQDLERSAKIAREISSIQGKVNAYEAGKKAATSETAKKAGETLGKAEKAIDDFAQKAIDRIKENFKNDNGDDEQK